MKKIKEPADTASDLKSAFDAAPHLSAVNISDDPTTPLDAEVQTYFYLKEILKLYCTKPGQTRTSPKTYLSSDEKWGPYAICVMPYEDDANGVFDPDIYDALRILAADTSMAARNDIGIIQRHEMLTLTFQTIEEMVQTCYDILTSEDCPGSAWSKQILLRKVPDLVTRVARERAEDGQAYANYHWHMH